MRLRAALGGVGFVVGVYGAYLLLSREGSTSGLVAAAIWLASGVVLHDFVLAPIVLVLLWVGRRVLPEHAHVATVVGLVVLGSVTILAIPVLGRFGARPDNPTLLDRHYLVGWAVLALLVLLCVVVGSLVVRRRHHPPTPASTTGGRRGVS